MWYVLRVEKPDDSVRVAKAMTRSLPTPPTKPRPKTESAFAANWVKQLGNIQFLIVSIGTIVFFTLFLVTGNTMAISVRERTSELAVVKAIGFSDRAVLFFVLAESLAIALIGGVIGLLSALLLIPVLAKALSGLLPNLILSPTMLASGLLVALLVGLGQRATSGLGAMHMARCECPQEV